MTTLIVTGASGLIGSHAIRTLAREFDRVIGIDNNMRAALFGPGGDTRHQRRLLESQIKQYQHCAIDIRSRAVVLDLFRAFPPDLVVHAAAQPSHDLAAQRPFDDFDINAVGTMNLLEATRQVNPHCVFVYLSTNKVYGDRPNLLPLTETATRWVYANPADQEGIDEQFPIDQSCHSLFGASKIAGDLMVQEYGRYFSMPTCCLRAGCLTGANQAGVCLHGFLNYLVRCVLSESDYTIFGYRGKQVRDMIHADDVCTLIRAFYHVPRCGEVYNIGGGKENTLSVLEALDAVSHISDKRVRLRYEDTPRKGDHQCYISNLTKIKAHYPEWEITLPIARIVEDLVRDLQQVQSSQSQQMLSIDA